MVRAVPLKHMRYPGKALYFLDNHPKKQFTDSGDHPQKHFSVKYNH
jgi:hypothetical protein